RPRRPELEQVLAALDASPSEQLRARGLAGAARERVRQQEAAADTLLGGPALLPGPGALLRALRHRRGLTLAETAARLALQPSSISRWERSEMLPAADRLEALLEC